MEDISGVNRSVLIVMPIFGALASVVSGYFIVYFTMLDEYVQKYHGFTDEQNDLYFTIMVAALPVGAFIGSFIYNGFIQAYGENKAMKILDIIAIVSVVMQVVTIYMPIVILSRFLMGFYCAITTALIPSWILSMSPSFTSGIFGTFNQIAIALGMAIAYSMGQFLETSSMDSQFKRRIFIGLPILNSFVHLFGLKYLGFDNIERMISKRQHNEVIRFMKLIYGKKWKSYEKQIRNFKMVPIEIPIIKQEAEAEANEAQNKIKENKEKSQGSQENKEKSQEKKKESTAKQIEKWKKKLLPKCENCESRKLAIMLAVANQASGIIAIFEYSKQIFVKIKENVGDADRTLLILGFFQVIVTFISGFFINKYGRRPMMLIGQSIIVASLFGCVCATYFIQKHQIITTVIIFIYVLGYSISLGPLFMMYAIETLSNLRLVLQIYWGLMLVLTLTTQIFIQQVSISLVFAIFFISSVLSLIFFCNKMIETKDVPKKEIKSLIQKNQFIWESSEYIFSQTIKQNSGVEKTLGTI